MRYIKNIVNNITEHYWEPDTRDVFGVIHVIHGMAEHLKRYHDFASYMANQGFVVCGIDLPGHGESLGVKKGFFADKNGADKVVNAILEFNTKVKERYKGAKVICLGHSMGSFFAGYIASEYPEQFSAYIFSGTAGKNRLIWLGKLIAKIEIRKNGAKHESVLLNKLSFGAYNREFKPSKTEFDWLSSNEDSVNEYVNDELCGFVFTSSAFFEVFKIMDYVRSKTWIRKLDKSKKYLFISGMNDPVGGKGKGVKKLTDSIKGEGIHNVKVILYENMRHEVLNEINKDKVYLDILTFVKEV